MIVWPCGRAWNKKHLNIENFLINFENDVWDNLPLIWTTTVNAMSPNVYTASLAIGFLLLCLKVQKENRIYEIKFSVVRCNEV